MAGSLEQVYLPENEISSGTRGMVERCLCYLEALRNGCWKS